MNEQRREKIRGCQMDSPFKIVKVSKLKSIDTEN